MRREIIETLNAANSEGAEKISHIGPTEGRSKELAYTDKFADFIKAHPNFLIKTKKAVDALFNLPVNEPVPAQEIDGVKIEYLGWHGRDERKYYKITIDGSEFFLKVNSLSNATSLFLGAEGVEGLLAMRKAKEALQGFHDFPVSIIDYQIGYKDANRTYFLASFDERMRTTADDELDSLWKKINKLRKDSKDQNVQELFRLTQTRDYLRQLYYTNIYIPEPFNQKRAAMVMLRLSNLDITINQRCRANLGVDASKFAGLIQAKDGLSLKYYQLRYYLNSKKLAKDFHEGQMSFDWSKNEALVFDLQEGNYTDIQDFAPDPEMLEIIRSLEDDERIAQTKKRKFWPVELTGKTREQGLSLMQRLYGKLEWSGEILRYETAIRQPDADPDKIKEAIFQSVVSHIKKQFTFEPTGEERRQFLEWLDTQATQAQDKMIFPME
jgi:hypothetical protein